MLVTFSMTVTTTLSTRADAFGVVNRAANPSEAGEEHHHQSQQQQQQQAPQITPSSSTPAPVAGQRRAPAPGAASERLAAVGVGIAPLSGDTSISALRACAWREGDVDRLYLDGLVHIRVGVYDFSSRQAVVWIRQVEYSTGQKGLHLAMLLEKVSTVTQPSGLSADSDELLVTAATIGDVALSSDVFVSGMGQAPRALLERAEARVLQALPAAPPSPTAPPTVRGPVVERQATPRQAPIDLSRLSPPMQQQAGAQGIAGRQPEATGVPPPAAAPLSAAANATQPEPAPRAVVSFRMDGRMEYALSADKSEGYLTLRDNLVLQYTELSLRPGESSPRQLTLTADRAVVFTDPIDPKDVQSQHLSASSVHGVYLEGNVVATDGHMTLRGPRMYYEFAANRAIVLDAVMHTYSDESHVPIYVRAAEIRQVTSHEWQAKEVRVSTSEFYTPQISLGARTATLERIPNEHTGQIDNYVTIRSATLRAGDVPFFWVPGFRGKAENFPLQEFTIGGNDRNGVVTKTQWDLFGLLGAKPDDHVTGDVRLEYWGNRGPAGGIDLGYKTQDMRGHFQGYIIQDDGTDKLASGALKDVNDETRGIAAWSHMQFLPNDWTVIAEGAYISDPNFIDSFFPLDAQSRRDYQSRLYAKQQRDNWAFEAFTNYDFNHFIANEDVLQSPGYQVEKVPEIGYYRLADALFGGKVSYSSEYQLSRMRLSFPRHTLGDIGQGIAGFGLPAGTDLTAAAIASGYRESFVDRFTTRQEMSMPMTWGDFKVIPFIMGRFSAYDDDFAEYSPDAEKLRYDGAGGVRIATTLSRVDNTVESRLFDLHRIRHIIEPSVTFWSSNSNASYGDYPIYDQSIEGVTTGTAVRMGMRNTWQTQRGGPGRWYSVDFLTLDTNFILSSGETQGDFTVPRFFDYRPEYSRLGDHFQGDFRWLASDVLAVSGDMIYDFNKGAMSRGAVGFRLDHARDLYSYGDLRYYDVDQSTLLSYGMGYQLSALYTLQGGITYDLHRSDSQSVSVALSRAMPQFDLQIGYGYDNIRQESTFSLSFVPHGAGIRSIGGVLNPQSDQNR